MGDSPAGRALPLLRWTSRERQRVLEILQRDVEHPQTFVRAWALDSLARFATTDRTIRPTVMRALRSLERSGMKALVTRARQIRARLSEPERARPQFTLEALFAGSKPEVLAAARKYVALLESLGDVRILPQKTRLVAVARVRFAGLQPRKDHFVASFALHRWSTSPRIAKTDDYGPRWRGHYVRIKSDADLNEEPRAWLQESHDVVGMQSDIAEGRGTTPKSSIVSG